MPKNIDDISLPERRKSIRNIPIPESRRKADRPVPVDIVRKNVSTHSNPAPHVPPSRPSSTPAHASSVSEDQYIDVGTHRAAPHPQRSSGGMKLWYAAGIALVIVVVGVLSFFNGATFSYVPRSAALTFENEAIKANKSGESNLLYSVVKLSRDKGLSAPATSETEVSRKASGVIIVYNNTSADTQTLVENTRFQSGAGKIYRIAKGITIPGKKTVGGVSQPGSVEATVFADQPGDTFNTGLTDFTVPGLKGTPKFETIYARSKTAISGGFVGKEKVVKAEDLTKAKSSLQETLKKDLWEEAQAEVPEDFVLFPTLSSYQYSELPQTSANDSSATVNMHGDLYAVMFKKSELAKSLSEKKLNLSQNDIVDILSLDALNIGFDGGAPADLLSLSEINLRVTGSTLVSWRTDEVALRADLLGHQKKEIPTILQNYPTIANATVSVRPFWQTRLPSLGDKIVIKKLPIQQENAQ